MKNNSSGFWAFNNRILGINEFRKHSLVSDTTDYNYPVEGLIALDKYTLQIKLTSPYPQLLYILTMHYSFAVPREAVEYYGKMFVIKNDTIVEKKYSFLLYVNSPTLIDIC